jgi:urease accessory protein
VVHGVTELAFAPGFGGRTRLKHLYQKAPARVLMPDSTDARVPLAVLLNTGGGLVGGDRIDISVEVAAGGQAIVTQQAAEKVYRAPEAASRVNVSLIAGTGSWLEWLPQETILFNGAQLRRTTTADVAAGGSLLAGEFLVFGRRARGETFASGGVEERWEIRRDGRTVWADALRLDGDVVQAITAPAGLNGAAAIATIVFAADAVAERLAAVRGWLADACAGGVRAAATAICGVLVVRWLADDALRLRTAFAQFWARFRHHIGGLSETLPRVWWS